MQTSLRIEGANCPSCFNETLDALTRLPGIKAVRGSFSGPCIEIDHDDVGLEAITGTIRSHLRGVEMFSSEVRMIPLVPVALSVTCVHHQPVEATPATSLISQTNRIVPSMTLGEIVTLHPSLAAALERSGLDYCCHGARTLAVAASEAGLDPQTVADELSHARVDEPPAEWASLGPADLVDHIEAVHHQYLWTEMGRISKLLDTIVNVHGDRHPELAEVRRVYTDVRNDFEPHLKQEEQVLFPMIRRLAGRAGEPTFETAEISAQIESLDAEHEVVGELLVELNRLTDGYSTPVDGCATYAACYRALAELESDTHLHIHKESNVLFPALRAQPAQGRA
jgi:regulator of cell morphogenesis and NO signaling